MDEIKDNELTLEMLPDMADAESVFKFAMSFNGYEKFGSFEKCAAAANSRKRQALPDLRNELFFEARASRHREDEKFLEVYRELRPLIEKALNGC